MKLRINTSLLLRVLADAALIQVALVAALVVRVSFILLVVTPEMSAAELGEQTRAMARFYALSAAPLTIICLALFAWHGFYTYGRHYQSRYKALVVAQAVFWAFVLFGFITYFSTLRVLFPRGALVVAWLLCTALLVGARVWSHLWRDVLAREESNGSPAAPRADVSTVLVVGGAGYIGSALIPKLLDREHRVRALDLLIYGDEPVARFRDHPRFELVQGDFRHIELVAEAMRGVDAVVHLGAIVGDGACELDENLTIEVNLSSTRTIASLARMSGVRRFVFASTCSVYGACEEMLDEHSQTRPLSLYGRTKLASEQILLSMTNETFAPTVLRMATLYGLSGRTRFDLVVNLLAAQAKIDGVIRVHGGEQWRPLLHVDDAAAAIALVLEKPSDVVAGEVFNVGSTDQNFTIAEIARQVQQQVVGAELRMEDVSDPRNYRVNFQKIHNALGYRVNWTLEEGIRQVLEAVASGEVADYRQPQYSNVELLRTQSDRRFEQPDWARRMIEDLVRE